VCAFYFELRFVVFDLYCFGDLHNLIGFVEVLRKSRTWAAMCLLLCGLLGGDGLVYSSICASFINKQLTADIHTRTQAHKARAHTPPGACLRTSLAQNNRQACTQNTHTHTTNCMRAQMHKYITNPPLHTCLRTEP